MLQSKKYAIIFLVSLALVLSVLIIVQLVPYRNEYKTEVKPINFIGTYQTLTDAAPIPLDENLIDASLDNQVVLKGHFDRPLLQGEQMLFLMEYMEVQIFLNSTKLYSFGTKDSRASIVNSSGMSWGHFVVPKNTSFEDEWTIVLNSKYKNNYYSAYRDFLNSLQTGDSGALARNVLNESGFYFLGSITFIFLGLLLLIYAFVLSARCIKLHLSVYLFSCFTITTCIWILFNPYYSTLVLDNTALVMQLETFSMMLSSLIWPVYLGTFMRAKTRQINNKILLVCGSLYVLFLILQVMKLADSYAVRDYLVVLMLLITAISIGEVLYEVCTCKNHEFQFMMIPCLVFLGFASVEIINYELEFIASSRILFIGFFILMTAQFIHAMRYIHLAILTAQKAAELELELERSQTEIMVSQINPHFLYNTLGTIAYLCDHDSDKAKKATLAFSDFLRNNLDTIGTHELIPFYTELNHVKNYLWIEKLRFGDNLNIEYDIKADNFLVPSLTLQPIVENAVRYGVTKKREGGTVKISTKETETDFIIAVEDDGVGFNTDEKKDDGVGFNTDEKKDDGRTHIGISNVLTRVAMQTGGTLEIESYENVGTTVTIKVPKRGE